MTSLPYLRQNIYLTGDVEAQILGNKLPSKNQVLKVLFFHLRHLKFTLSDSKQLVIKEALIFWKKAGIPTQAEHRCCDKLEKLYNDWRKLQKSANKPSNIEKENEFTSMLNDVFDIAHGDVDELIDEKRRDFLLCQREAGRKGYIADFQTSHDIEEDARTRREEIENARKRKAELEQNSLGKL